MATATQSKMSAENSERTRSVCCSSCSENGDNSAAGHYCVDCEIYMCFKCLKCHNRIPATKSHQVNNVEYAGTETREQLEDELSKRPSCHKHLGENIDSYCFSHEELCCGTCVMMKHRACQVRKIAVIARDFKSGPKVKQYKESLSNILIDLNQKIDVRMENLASLEQNKTKMLKSLDKYEDDIIAMVTKHAEMSRKQIRKEYIQHKKELDSDVAVLKTTVAATVERVDKIALSNDEQLFAYIETGKLFMKDNEKLLQAMSSNWSKREIEFRLDEDIKLPFYGGESFEDIEKYEAILLLNKRLNIRRNIYVGLNMCTLESGDIFITDHYFLNRYCSEFELKERIETLQYPVAVCQVSANEVAVRSHTGIVHIIFVQSTMKVETYFQVEGGNFGLAYDASDEEFLVCEGFEITVYSKAGHKLRTLETTNNGERIFFECQQIYTDTDTKNIYVTDCKRGLMVLYRSGDMKRISLGKNSIFDLIVKSPIAFCKLPGDMYLQSHPLLNKIVQFDKHGNEIGMLIKDVKAHSMVYDRVHSRLIVGGVGDSVNVYTLFATRKSNAM